MSAFDAPRLTNSDEAAILKLLRAVRATQYDDPVDQDEFLVASAKSVLEFRPQVASFAMTPEVGECVSTIRTHMARNNAKLKTPPNDVFADIQDFAGEIVRKRQLFRDRQLAKIEVRRGVEGAAARAERRDALEYAAKIKKSLPDDDAVSIPSSDENSEPPSSIKCSLPTPVEKPSNSLPPLQVPTLPMSELEGLIISLMVGISSLMPLPSPSSPSQSLPDLVPMVDCLLSSAVPTSGNDWTQMRIADPPAPRGRVRGHHPPLSPISIPDVVHLIPRPYSPARLDPNPSFVDVWLASEPNFVDSRVQKNTSSGSFNHSQKSRAAPSKSNAKFWSPKRCFRCADPNHLVQQCPKRRVTDRN
ncbi:hypothetical protein GGX14DRAFT_562680 [Mycena pura]|uniref:CCHC-type domain-containing protein n=1 Tax=Mycena pura TaxID=153505 RepID=A0AAD6VKA6_9AGAR|nr:hypothetical protein GGX14DRAFT_562680 [Mycena pura]